MGRPDVSPLQTKIVHALRKRVDMRNRVRVFYAEIANEVGVSKSEVHDALVLLNDDGFFPGKPSFSTDRFDGRLPS